MDHLYYKSGIRGLRGRLGFVSRLLSSGLRGRFGLESPWLRIYETDFGWGKPKVELVNSDENGHFKGKTDILDYSSIFNDTGRDSINQFSNNKLIK
uniref:Uncharacterized protein n=1 Tax=Nelumbo nucifera TaxID=4432 RepID=A0A822ZAD3_NELNU|nr:TPA_asm: hypothetical protein HUJ06_014728 [Nelumbo nucifera]